MSLDVRQTLPWPISVVKGGHIRVKTLDGRISKRAVMAVGLCIAVAWYIATASLMLSSAHQYLISSAPRPRAPRDGAGSGKSLRPPAVTVARQGTTYDHDREVEELHVPPLRPHGSEQERKAGAIELQAGSALPEDESTPAVLPPREDQEGAKEAPNFVRASGSGRDGWSTGVSRFGGEEMPAGKRWPAMLPNAGRTEDGDKGVDVDSGTRSKYYGDVQRERQRWLATRIVEVSEVEGGRFVEWRATQKKAAGGEGPKAERVRLLERGVKLWNATYVPPIEPARRRALIDKWSGMTAKSNGIDQVGTEGKHAGTGRVLFMVTTFDRGQSTHKFRGDKFDLILVMMDEMREACEAGFSPHVHLIAAWDVSEVKGYLEDRLFCRRIGDYVSHSLEIHPPSIKKKLSLKHRLYVKSRVNDFDLFIQAEDDMITTLNHIMLYQEESELLGQRRMTQAGEITPNSAVPGFIRVEPLGGNDDNLSWADPSKVEWIEWEIILSRFRPVKIHGAGVYLTLDPSNAIPKGGNCQAMWMATQDQLKRLSKQCNYLGYNEASAEDSPEYLTGGLQMFGPGCGFQKVFPAQTFESYLIHHAANNKAGLRGESVPGVPVSLLRDWVEQFLRDEHELHSEGFYDFDRLEQQASK